MHTCLSYPCLVFVLDTGPSLVKFQRSFCPLVYSYKASYNILTLPHHEAIDNQLMVSSTPDPKTATLALHAPPSMNIQSHLLVYTVRTSGNFCQMLTFAMEIFCKKNLQKWAMLAKKIFSQV